MRGSVYIAVSFALAGVLTYAFQSLYFHALGKAGYAPLALLWSATFLTVQVLWIGATQTLGRYVAEREAHSRDWAPVVASVRHWQIGLAVAFVLAAVLASPLLTGELFEDPWLTAAFIVAVVLYAPEYFRRGIFNGHRQSFGWAPRSWPSRRPGAGRRRAARRGMGRLRASHGHRARPSRRRACREARARAAA